MGSYAGTGKTTPTTVKDVTITGPLGSTAANLTFTANGVDNINGAFGSVPLRSPTANVTTARSVRW